MKNCSGKFRIQSLYTTYDRLIGGVNAVCTDLKNIKAPGLVAILTKSFEDIQKDIYWTEGNGIICALLTPFDNSKKRAKYLIELHYSPDKETESKSILNGILDSFVIRK